MMQTLLWHLQSSAVLSVQHASPAFVVRVGVLRAISSSPAVGTGGPQARHMPARRPRNGTSGGRCGILVSGRGT